MDSVAGKEDPVVDSVNNSRNYRQTESIPVCDAVLGTKALSNLSTEIGICSLVKGIGLT